MAADATAARRDLPQLFAEEMGQLIGPDFPPHLSLAVSGGGDSMAMLYLAAPWARVMGIKLEVLTVHHHLRAGAEDEIALVSAAAQELGLPHRVLHWHWNGAGNLGEAAREGRYAALAEAAGQGGHIVVAHTQDDQAETFLMNLARGSGVDGLAAMSPLRRSGEVTLLRPLLEVTRDELRHFLKVLRIDYADDPSNNDPASTRIQMRQAAESLAALGLTRARLAGTASAMARARHALEARTLEAHEALVDRGPGEMLFDLSYPRDGFDALDRETQLRLLAAAIRYVGLAPDRPRLATLEDALDRACSGGATTLHGCYLYPHRDRLFVCAEFARVRDVQNRASGWRGLYKTGQNDVRALGEAGAAQIRNQTDLPARVLWPCPAVWAGDRVLATPRLGPNELWSPVADPRRFARLLSSR